MTTSQQRRLVLEFAAVLAQELPDEKPHCISDLACQLMKLSKRHSGFALIECNRSELTEREQCQRRRVEEAIRKLLPESFRVKFGGDPRGYTVKLLLPSGRFNTWGGAEEGYGVPGS